MTKQEKIEFVLNDLKQELLDREKFSVQAVVHSRDMNFGEYLTNTEPEDGCVIFYLNGATEERLFNDLKSRYEPAQRVSDGDTDVKTDGADQTTGDENIALETILEGGN